MRLPTAQFREMGQSGLEDDQLMNQVLTRFDCGLPISVALAAPVTRLAVIGVSWEAQGERKDLLDHVVAIKSLIVDTYWTVDEGQPPKGSSREEFLRYGWSFAERIQRDQHLIVTDDGKLVDAREHYDRFLNVLTRLVVCPWAVEEDVAKLTPIYDQIWTILDSRLNVGLELLDPEEHANACPDSGRIAPH